jgi:hypothetical protein
VLGHFLHPPGNRGQHIVLYRDSEQQIPDWIEQSTESRRPVTRHEIKNYCTSQFQTPITRGRGNLFIVRRPDPIIYTKSVPQEEQLLQVPQAFLERTVQDLKEYIQGCTTELVFNLDVVGISDWQDRISRLSTHRPRCGDVPRFAICGQMIVHGISQNVKQVSAIACISPTGTWSNLAD